MAKEKDGYKKGKLVKVEGYFLIEDECDTREIADKFNCFMEENNWNFRGKITEKNSIEKSDENTGDSRLQDIWEDALAIMKQELTEISFKTWMEPIKPYSMEDNKLSIIVENEFSKGIIEGRYNKLICSAIKFVTGMDIEIQVLVEDKPIIESYPVNHPKTKSDQELYLPLEEEEEIWNTINHDERISSDEAKNLLIDEDHD